MAKLPVKPRGKLAAVFDEVSPEAGEVLRKHLLGGTSAEWLAQALQGEVKDPPSATAIRTYRRQLSSERSV